LTVVNYNLYKMMGIEGLGPAMLENISLQMYQFFTLHGIFPINPPGKVFDATEFTGKVVDAQAPPAEVKPAGE